MESSLTDLDVRVLGSLIEKEITTPDNYPLTLNALVAACNQTSNRDPVLTLDEATVSHSIEDLRKQSLVRAVQRSDSRAMRYRQLLSEVVWVGDCHPERSEGSAFLRRKVRIPRLGLGMTT